MRNLVALCVLASCAGSDAVSIEDIPDDTPLTALSPAQEEGVCDWAWAEVEAATAMQPPGLRCQPQRSGCFVPDGCAATLGQFEACFPALLARLSGDACELVSLALLGELSAFIEETPGCAGVGSCAFVRTLDAP